MRSLLLPDLVTSIYIYTRRVVYRGRSGLVNMEDDRENKYAPALSGDEIRENQTAMSLQRQLQDELEKITHPENASVVFQDHEVGEVNEAAMSDQVLSSAQILYLAFSTSSPSSQASATRVSNDVMGRESPKQAHNANPPPYFQKLVGILGLGSGSSVTAAFNNFDKQRLIAIHNKGLNNQNHAAGIGMVFLRARVSAEIKR